MKQLPLAGQVEFFDHFFTIYSLNYVRQSSEAKRYACGNWAVVYQQHPLPNNEYYLPRFLYSNNKLYPDK